MKIHIFFEFKDGPWGGGNQFLKALRKEFVSQNVYEEEACKSDAIIFNSHHKLDEIVMLRKKHPKILLIHRLDGPIQLVRGYDEGLDTKIFEYNNKYADATIFQSTWIKKESEKLGLKINFNHAIILNAPDETIFNKKKTFYNPLEKIKIIASSWSGNIRKGFDVYEWLDNNLDFSKYEFTFVGNSPIKFKNIKHIQPLPSIQLAEKLRENHIYLTASKFEPCSNALIEALHCGLPAIAYNNGGNPEIIGKAGELFTNNEEIIEKLELIRNKYNEYQNNIKLLNMKQTAIEYYNFINSLKKNFFSFYNVYTKIMKFISIK